MKEEERKERKRRRGVSGGAAPAPGFAINLVIFGSALRRGRPPDERMTCSPSWARFWGKVAPTMPVRPPPPPPPPPHEQ